MKAQQCLVCGTLGVTLRSSGSPSGGTRDFAEQSVVCYTSHTTEVLQMVRNPTPRTGNQSPTPPKRRTDWKEEPCFSQGSAVHLYLSLIAVKAMSSTSGK